MLDQIRTNIANLPRLWKQVTLIGFDVVALLAAVWLSYTLRSGTGALSPDVVVFAVAAPVIAIPIFAGMGLYRAVIRFLPERAVWRIVQAMICATIAWAAVGFAAQAALGLMLPRSVPFIYCFFGTNFVGGSRFLAKLVLMRGAGAQREEQKIVIYGAGHAGMQLAAALTSQPNKSIVGFVDGNRHLRGREVAGIRVHAPAHLPTLIEEHGATEVILSMPSLGASERSRIVREVAEHGVKVRTLPPLSDVVQGRYLVSQIREIDIDELLGRSSVPPDFELVGKVISGRTIMVTGAGGSIGSELCRLIARWSPRCLVLFEANEFALYKIERELTNLRDFPIIPVLGSVTDAQRVRHAITAHGVDVVYHAAAHKHVPLVEANALEGIRNNVFGSLVVAETALATGVETFVLISSDKAVRPTNVMGATKRWAELIVAHTAHLAELRGTGQRFCSVRFGNVLGSNGSVVPLFKEQIAIGGPVTLTDPRMTRYFMSIHEAAELIVQASALSRGGDLFLLEMGSPVLIRDLAENMIRLAGFTVRDERNPDGDIQITATGTRPGEKMYEELFYDESHAARTLHPKILRSTSRDGSSADIESALRELRQALDRHDDSAARRILFDTAA